MADLKALAAEIRDFRDESVRNEKFTAESFNYSRLTRIAEALAPSPYKVGDVLHTHSNYGCTAFYIVTGVVGDAVWGVHHGGPPSAGTVVQLNLDALRLASEAELRILRAR